MEGGCERASRDSKQLKRMPVCLCVPVLALLFYFMLFFVVVVSSLLLFVV